MNTRRKAIMTAASVALAVTLSTGAALAAEVPGTNRGEVLRGTPRADTIHGFGGADLIYGLGGNDTVWGGNERGKGDKVLGGPGEDRLVGQMGHDALYGGVGNDTLEGQRGDDLLQGDYGEDTIDAGPGADQVNAQDGELDFIDLRDAGPGDVVYYDRGLDVLVTADEPVSKAAGVSAAEASEATGATLTTAKAPESLFAHTGKVLVEHEGEERLVAEKALKGHLAHGDEIVDPTGRSGATEGRR